MQWRTKIALAAPALVAATLATAAPSGAGRGEAGMQAVRQHTDQYHSEAAAVADGFVPTDECVPGMGYHYVNFERLDGRLQLSRPEAVLYAPTEDGGRRLVAAEWIVVDDDQDLSTDHDRPTLFGQRFDGPMPGHGEGMPIHYDLHVYAWVTNPDGGFATWNPVITCP